MDNAIVTVYGLSRRPRLRLQIEKIIKLILRHFRLQGKAIDVTFLSNAEMVLLKRRYLKNKKGPANTLSFEIGSHFPVPPGFPESIGEILLNAELTEYKIQKIAPLLIHSTLHLLGYHHEKERDTILMDRLAESVSKSLRL